MKHIFLSAFLYIVTTSVCNAQAWSQSLKANATFKDIQHSYNDYYKSVQAPYNEFANKENAAYFRYKRWENFVKHRLDANGHFLGNQLMKEFQKTTSLKTNQNTAVANWQYIGPTSVPADGGGAGRINTLEFDPTNPTTMWIGAANGGLWKSVNGGTSWTSNTDFLANISVADIAINPQNTNEMYVATGDNSGYEVGNYFWGGTYSSGILKSTNGGLTWNTTGLNYTMTNFNVIHKILLFPNNPQTLIIAHRQGIERSTDGGATWSNVSFNQVYDFEIDPSNPLIVYAVGDGLCLKSTDQGLTWASTSVNNSFGRMSISISPANANKMYVLTQQGDLYNSTNAGSSFTLINNVPLVAGISLYGYYDCVLAVSPTNANEVYVAGLDVAKSTNGGANWTVVGDWQNYQNANYLHADNHYIEFLPNSGTTLFSCNDGGIFKSMDNGLTWTDLSANLQIAQYYRIGTAQSLPSRYFLGQQDNGTVEVQNNNFAQILTGDGMESVVDKQNADYSIISYQNGNFFQTTDNWITYNPLSLPSGVGAWTTPIELNNQNQNTVYVALDEVYKSLDFGLTWNPISSFGTFNEIEFFTVAPSNSNYMYLANDEDVFYTHDGGITWTKSVNGLTISGFYISSISVSNINPNKVWLTYSGYNANSKVFVSKDGGVSWANYSGTLPNIPCNTIVYQPNSKDELYVGSDFGVYYRDSTMLDWTSYQTNLPNVIVNELEIVTQSNTIRAATFGRGVWESPLKNPIAIGIEEIETSNLITLYPNPTQGILYVNYKAEYAVCTLSIKDVLGKEVFTTILSEKQKQLDIKQLEAGVYFYEINNNKTLLGKGKFIKE